MKGGIKVTIEQLETWIDEEGREIGFLKKLAYDKRINILGIRFLYNGSPLEGYYWDNFPAIFSPYIAFMIKCLVQSDKLFLYVNPLPIPISLNTDKSVKRWSSLKPKLIFEFKDSFCLQFRGRENGVIFECPLKILETIITLYWNNSAEFEGYIIKNENVSKFQKFLLKLNKCNKFGSSKILKQFIDLSKCIFKKDYCDTGIKVISSEFNLKTVQTIISLRKINWHLKHLGRLLIQ